MPRQIELATDEKCTGCMACQNICHKNAIHTVQNKQGFYRPQIDFNICVKCGQCESICPQKNNLKYYCDKQEYYAFKNNDEIRKNSSSGGVFTWISDAILKQNGVIIGCVLDENLKVVHIATDNEEQRNFMRGSKYVQSEIGYIYRAVKQYLDDGRKVLFSGTPCQCEGLLAFLGQKQDITNLMTLDFICRGGISPQIFCDFISYYEKKANINIKYVIFRDKNRYKHRDTIFGRRLIVAEHWPLNVNENFIYNRKINDRFHDNMFLGVLQQDVCQKCKFHSYNRCTDFTCGDFHRYKRNDGFNDELGISELLVNTEKAREFLQCHGNEVILKNVLKEETWQPLLGENVKESNYRRWFWIIYKRSGFEIASSIILVHVYKNKVIRKIEEIINKIRNI